MGMGISLAGVIKKQLNHFWDNSEEELTVLDQSMDAALKRAEYCFSYINNKYYSVGGGVNHLHGCQYASLLYFVSNTIYHRFGNHTICDKVYLLNKIVSSMELYYEIEMPRIFFFDHPVGSVIGRGRFSDYFSFSQGCTVGNNHGCYPEFSERVVLLANATVIGRCRIGRNVVISAGTYVKDQDIPDNSIVFGKSPELIIKERRDEEAAKLFRGIFKIQE